MHAERETGGPCAEATQRETREGDCEGGTCQERGGKQKTRVVEAERGSAEGVSRQALCWEGGSGEYSWWHGGHCDLDKSRYIRTRKVGNPTANSPKRLSTSLSCSVMDFLGAGHCLK